MLTNNLLQLTASLAFDILAVSGSLKQSVLPLYFLVIYFREHEDAFVQQRDERKPGGEWERVCRLCDFNPKGSRNTKDIQRMRSILLQLKQTPNER